MKLPRENSALVLSLNEKKIITSTVHEHFKKKAQLERRVDLLNAMDKRRFMLCTAYSDDYIAGHLCSKINGAYAQRYDFEFVHEVKTTSEMLHEISPKRHCTWYKIYLLRKLFQDRNFLRTKCIQYVMWIDADAVVVNFSAHLNEIICLGKERDLIIAEDLNPACLINAGVFLLRVTEWSRNLLDKIWNTCRFDNVPFYEQSALIKCLRSSGEGLEHVNPFHSYLRSTSSSHASIEELCLQFAHVAVLPHIVLNTSKLITDSDVEHYLAKEKNQYPCVHVAGVSSGFIFHPAGCKNKSQLIAAAIWKYNLYPYCDFSSDSTQLPLITAP